MAFELPNLDSKSYQQLVTDLMRRIPQYTKLWTDYNDSDPGITMLQLLAWLDESLLYQANRIPTLTDENFLRWVLGLAFSTNQTEYSLVAEDKKNPDFDFLDLRALLAQIEQGQKHSKQTLQKEVLSYLQSPYLALTLPNIEALALQSNRKIAWLHEQQQAHADGDPPLYVQQAHAENAEQASVVYILSDAPREYQLPDYPNRQQYGNAGATMRRLLLLQPRDRTKQEKTLLDQVGTYLQPRVIAGSALRVRMAPLTAIDVSLSMLCSADTELAVTLAAAMQSLFAYLQPDGGPDGQGWRYGQAPSADDLKQLALSVPGVAALETFNLNHIPTVMLDQMAELGANTLLASFPAGRSAMLYQGFPRLRCLDITVKRQQP
ncbi:hypothetical protein [Paraherbaspirillum soli]|uniref:Baseplate protein J-like domain-containing protein n=1 Tax=Paraherbaspirillum soli TaxID=631222 RepID=A0ABW0MF33_9BURK